MEPTDRDREPQEISDAGEPDASSTPAARPVRKGQECILTATAAAFEGGCVARYEGFAVFVSGCVPGDTVRALITKTRKRHAEARTLEVLEPSTHRVEPPCQYFGTCGGCKWQNLAYEQQLSWKRQHVVDAFQRIAGLELVDVRPTIGSPEEYWYRNKMEFSFSDQRWLTDDEINSREPLERDFALGLHIPGRYDRVLDIRKCWLESDRSNAILNATREFARSHDLKPYSSRTHEGLLRNLVIRESRSTGETMVILVTSEDATDTVDRYAGFLLERVPEVSTIVQGINRKRAQIAFSEETRVLHGSGVITERVAGNDFTISPFSFFQTNSIQADRLYAEALAAAEIGPGDTLWDLYCGAGSITLAAAKRGRRAIGVELNEGAILDARANALRNGVDNATFIAGDLAAVLGRGPEGAAEDLGQPDVVITDPPRAGMHADVVQRLLELAPERISYVSCNPTTQARDCALLAERYDLVYVQPVDMFPQTYHVETVAKLVRKE